MSWIVFGFVLIALGIVVISWTTKRSTKSWMDNYEKLLLQQEEINNDEGTVSNDEGERGGNPAATGGGVGELGQGAQATRQTGDGHGNEGRRRVAQAGYSLRGGMTQAGFHDKTKIVKEIIHHKLEYLERERRNPDVVAQYEAIAEFDPTLARLLDEVDYAAIKPMRKVLDHFRRKDVVYLVKKPGDDKND